MGIYLEGPTLIVIILVWSGLVSGLTYMYMSNKVEKLLKHIESIENDYGHIIDDYIEHYAEEEKK
jgi:uncharacterized protein YeeX (DUF496 family)